MDSAISSEIACRDLRKNADWSWDNAREPRPMLARDERPVKPASTDAVCHVSRKERASANCPAPLPAASKISKLLAPCGSRANPTTPDDRSEAMSSALALASL